MRKRSVRVLLGLAAAATLALSATAAYGGFFAGTYAGRITGVQGISLPKGGNMKFKITAGGRVTSFKWSKIYVACTDGNVHPFFGTLTGKQWGETQYKHVDHHFRQFGV